ncbi:hypothetical protein EalM132_00078 [Exiguobacterium phage vB_EalM-132]|nr:hypothetical protein EalM132_00078 [Exiguobacterium phage vB_EalM-132]
MAYGEEDIKIRIDADTKDALRSLKNLEQQVDKLGDMADQGEREQKGFLSPKQVTLYKRILAEMEKEFTQHQKRLSQAQDKYSQRYNRQEYEKLKRLEQELKKREEDYLKASNRGVSPGVEEFHRSKLEEARTNLDEYKGSDEYKSYELETERLESNIEDLTEAVEALQSEMHRSLQHQSRIEKLNVSNPTLNRQVDGVMSTLASIAGLTGVGAYAQYSMNGIDMLRSQQQQGYEVSQRLDEYNGVSNSDAKQRERAQIIGEGNNYGLQDTLHLQSILQHGGTQSAENLDKDTDTIQKYSRAYATDANVMAESTNFLKKIGATSEGEMDKFARMLAGAIEKTGANGREEEILRANMSLVSSVSQGMAKLTEKQLGNVMGLQAQLADNSPTLMGDRGSQVLSGMDSAFKGGGHELEILMGKGTKYNTITEMAELRRNMAHGIARPENITDLLDGIERQFGDIHSSPQADAIAQEVFSSQMGIDPLMYQELKESGTLKEWSEGRMPSAEDFEQIGDTETAKKMEKYLGTDTSEIQNVEAQAENFQADHAKAYEEIATNSRSAMHNGIPDPLQHMLLPFLAGGVTFGGGMLATKLGGGLFKRLMPTVKEYMNGGKGLGGLGGKAIESLKGLGGRAGSVLGGAKDGIGSLFSKIGGTGGTATTSGTSSLGRNILAGSGKILSKAPLVGAAVGTGIDQLVNPENSWGRSIAKGVGGAIGGTLGFMGGTALGLGTGGVGFLGLGATTIGGGMAGEAIADKAYSLIAGDSDIQPVETNVEGVSSTAPTQTTAMESLEIGELIAQNVRINDKSLSELMESMSKEKAEEQTTPNTPQEQVIRIILEGDIKGMTKSNQGKVTDALVDLFSMGGTNAYKGYSGWKNNLAVDEYRK